MGHSVTHYTEKVTTEKKLQAWISQITDCAYDPQETGSYHGNLTIHRDKVYKDYDEALAAIELMIKAGMMIMLSNIMAFLMRDRKRYRSGMRKEMHTLKHILSIGVLQNMSAARNAEAG